VFNQVGELLPRADGSRGAERRPNLLAWLGSGPRRTLARLLPLVAVFAILEWLILTGRESFTAALGYTGALIIPILGGVLPMLMLAAGRRRGPYVPGTVLRAIGHPATVVSVAGLYLVAVLVHGLFIWQGPLERAAAVVASLLMAVIIVLAIRAGSFRPRAVLEIRADDRTDGLVTCALTATGHASPVEVVVERRGAERVPTSAATRGELGRLNELAAITVTLREAVPPLEVWAHRVDVAGDSLALAVEVGIAPPGRDVVGSPRAELHVGPLEAGTRIRVDFPAAGTAPASDVPDLRATFADAGLPQPERVR